MVICGDMNVAHKEIDLKNPKTNKKNAGFTQEERDSFTELLEVKLSFFITSISPGWLCGHVQALAARDQGCLHLLDLHDGLQVGGDQPQNHQEVSRAKNVGWRLDYFLVSSRLVPRVTQSVLREKVAGGAGTGCTAAPGAGIRPLSYPYGAGEDRCLGGTEVFGIAITLMMLIS